MCIRTRIYLRFVEHRRQSPNKESIVLKFSYITRIPSSSQHTSFPTINGQICAKYLAEVVGNFGLVTCGKGVSILEGSGHGWPC